MNNNESTTVVPLRLFIQINGKKTACVESTVSKTIQEFRKVLFSQGVQLHNTAQFLDAQGYPVPIGNEKSFHVSDLIVSSADGKIIKLEAQKNPIDAETERSSKITVKNVIILVACLSLAYYFGNKDNRQSFIEKLLCPVLVKLNNSALLDYFDCFDNGTIFIDTRDYLINQINNNKNGTEVLVENKERLQKLSLADYNQHYVAIIDDWSKNRAIYKEDYDWYNNMKSVWGHCPGHFNEKVEHSSNLIENTPESIQDFIGNEFKDWPETLIVKINLKKLQSAINTETDNIDFKVNGKISTNMYLIAWKREENNTIRIHTYVTIFERTAGEGCHFVPEYWTGRRDKINNAKKYYLLTKIESNPVYKEFLFRIPQLT